MPDATSRVDPLSQFNFKLLIQGVTQGHFTACSGLGVKVEAIAYREGGTDQIIHKIPGQVHFKDVTLRYGVTETPDLWEWVQMSIRGHVDRRNVSIVMLSGDGTTEVVRWNLIDAWPTEWEGAPLDALGCEMAVEALTLTFEGLERG
jgi:phage tail-like protein